MITLALATLFLILSGVIETFLLNKTASEYSEIAQTQSVQIAPVFASAASESLHSLLLEISSEYNCRTLIVGNAGVVQADAFSQLNGTKLNNKEINAVLNDGKSISYGFYYLEKSSGYEKQYPNNLAGKIRKFIFGSDDKEWVMYCVTPIISGNNIYGALVLSVPIEHVVAQIELIKWQILLVSVATGIGAIVLITLFSGTMLKPIRQLTQGISKIASGDFTQRVKVSGNSEMAQLAKTFNEMSERLENLDHTRNEFVANASHELKTPMSTIKILVETLQHQKKIDPEITKELLGDVSSEIDRMSLLVGDLLSLVRLDEEKAESLPFRNICLSEILLQVCDILVPIAYKRRIDLNLSITADIYYFGDEAKLKRVFINLIDNAIKYSDDNSIVEVALSSRLEGIIFSVKDYGVGISEEDIPYIFDRFYRADKTRSRQTGGTGLGLSIVKSIVLLHSGKIDIASTLGQGTQITVTLPHKTLELKNNDENI